MKWKAIKSKVILWFEATIVQLFLNCEPDSSIIDMTHFEEWLKMKF